METNTKTYCKNCNQSVSDKYCQYCGQRTIVDKITFQETFQDFAYSMFSVDAPLVTTLKLLVINPGKLFREFLAGKRKRYYKPVAFFILTTVVYLLTRSLLDYNPFQDNSIIVVDENASKYIDGSKLTLARNFMLFNIDKFLFVFVFTLSLFLKLFFFKKYTLAEFVAISFYLIGVYTIFTALNMFYIQYTASVMQVGALFLMFVYFTYAMLSFFKTGKLLVLFKSLPLLLLALFLFMAVAFGFSYAIIFLRS